MSERFHDKVRSAIIGCNMLSECGGRVCVALSGGADSVSLLTVLNELREQLGTELFACHLNHGLRGEESDRDERFCRGLCEELGVPFYSSKISVSELANKHESIEQAARRGRYAFFEEALAHFGADVLATAHNANDNAETVLLNMARGTGLKGLCGIPPVRSFAAGRFRVIRPLICCERAEIEEFLKERGRSCVTDATNFSEDYTRNKIRLRIIPELKEIDPSVVAVIGRMTRNLRADSEFLDSLAEKSLAAAREGRGWNAAELSRLPEPIKARAIRRILITGGIEPSTLRIETAAGLLEKRSARYNPCKDRFFTIRKGICFVENIVQNYRNRR